MNNSQISIRINRLAAMMSLLEENPFKTRSFERAARIVRDHEEDMGILVDEDRLKDVPGIGPKLAYVIMYYAKAGTAGLEKELEAQLPRGLADLLDLPGLGMKKVQLLWKKYDVTSIEALKQACDKDALSGMKGFGPKLQARLLKAIAFQKKHARDFYLDSALSVAQNWVDQLSPHKSISRIELTGRIRRGDKLIQAVELLIEADSSELLADLNENIDCTVSESGSIMVKDISGLEVHFWLSTKEAFSAQQLIRTGGEAYSEQLNAMYGDDPEAAIQTLSQVGGSTILSEKALCESVNIQWIEPELRDTYATFPEDVRLVEQGDIKGVFHAHSTWSDGRNSLEELAEAVRINGYQYLGISEHSQAAYYANGLKPERVKAQWELIDQLNDTYSDFHIFKGIEADILSDGSIDYDEELLSGFDFVIASIHSHFQLDPNKQTERIVRALQSPYTTMLGHPTGRMLMARPGYNPDLPTIINAAAENNKLIEINTTPKRLDLDWRYLKYAREQGVSISINPDAHSISGLKSIPLGVRMARKGGYSSGGVINTMDVADMKTYLQTRKVS